MISNGAIKLYHTPPPRHTVMQVQEAATLTPPASTANKTATDDKITLSLAARIATENQPAKNNQTTPSTRKIDSVQQVMRTDLAQLGENLQVALRGLGIGPNTNLNIMTGIDGSIVINGPIGFSKTLERQVNGSEFIRGDANPVRRLHMNNALIGAYNNNASFRQAFNNNPNQAINEFSLDLQQEMQRPISFQHVNGETKLQDDTQTATR